MVQLKLTATDMIFNCIVFGFLFAQGTTKSPLPLGSKVDEVRLANGPSNLAGRVEVLVNGTWGTVCDDSFEIHDANVICRMLDLPAAKSFQCCSKIYGPGSGKIWLDNLRCLGSETSINQCSHNGLGKHNCGHSEDVGVVCMPRINSLKIHCKLDNNNCRFLNVKGNDFDWILKNGPTSSKGTGPRRDRSGYGRYYYMEASGRFGRQRARLQFRSFRLYYRACLTFYYHMYGSDMGILMVLVNGQLVWKLYGNQGNQWHKASVPILHPGPKKVTFEGIVEKGFRSDIAIDEISVVEHETLGSAICDFVPSCAKGPKVYEVRLAGAGRVEVFVNGTWGTVCDDYFDKADANVICRMLGFPAGKGFKCCSKSGRGSGPIWLDNLRCLGNETSINQCSHNGLGVHNCKHSEDVGVDCMPRPISSSIRSALPGVGPKEIHCKFDDTNCGMVNLKKDDFDWILKKGATSSKGTGPKRDITGWAYGRYYYMEASGRRKGQRAILKFRSLDLNYRACLTFYYHMYGSDMGTLMVEVNSQLAWKLSGNQGNQWHIATVPFRTNGYKQITFEGVVGKGFRSDIAIDEISVVEHEAWEPAICVFAPTCAKIPQGLLQHIY